MAVMPIVKIVSENKQGYIIINKEDFRQSTHELFVEKLEEVEKVEEVVKEEKSSKKKKGAK